MQQDITPQQAREQLAEAEAATERRAGDRPVHAMATAGFGLVIGTYLALSRVVADTSWESVVIGSYVLLLVTLAGWQGRAARTWPRHARRLSWIGLRGTVVLFLAAVVGSNVVRAHQESDATVSGGAVLALLAAGLVVALPMLVAALLIRRGEQR